MIANYGGLAGISFLFTYRPSDILQDTYYSTLEGEK